MGTEQLPGWVVPATVAFAFSFAFLRSWYRRRDEETERRRPEKLPPR